MENRAKKAANDLIDALIAGNVEKIENLLCDDCKIHLPFATEYGIHLESKLEAIEYLKTNFGQPTCEEIIDRKSVASDETHAVVNFKGKLNKIKYEDKVYEYCVFCEVDQGKIKELYAII